MRLNRPQLSVLASQLRPLIKPDGRISRIRLSKSRSAAALPPEPKSALGNFESTRRILLRGHRPRPATDARTGAPPSLRPRYRSFFATMQDSDFPTDTCRLTGRTGLHDRLNFGLPLVHRLGPPRLSGACLSDVLTTLTPAEFAGHGDWVSCKRRPSHNTPEARRLRAFNITRLIVCGSFSFRPVGSLPGLLNPLQPRGWPGTWPFRREPPNSTGGTCTHEQHTLRGLLRGNLFVVRTPILTFSKPRRGDLSRPQSSGLKTFLSS